MHCVHTTFMKKNYQKTAEIINIGDELLAGHTLNSNATWMSKELKGIGVKVTKHIVIADEKHAINAALDQIDEETTYIFITGGLGPTEDDRTKAVITAYFGGELEYSEEIFKYITDFFTKRGRYEVKGNPEQALFPNNAERIPNLMGTASGMIFRKNKKIFYLMPGVPFEMKHMMQNAVLPSLRSDNVIENMTFQINTFGVGESAIAAKIDSYLNTVIKDIGIGYYPSVNGVTIRLNGNKKEQILSIQKRILHLLGDIVYSTEGETLEELIVSICKKKKLLISTAESCTGGLTASKITDVPGSSEIFKEGFIVYSNEAKIRELGVSEDIIIKHGAVSPETVEAMVRGLKNKTGADITIGISGIAGPDGAAPDKPVGLVYIAVLYRDNLHIRKVNYDRGRKNNKEYAAHAALNEVRLALLETE
jgi:competence/damage-inducible protein CinA-like protein